MRVLGSGFDRWARERVHARLCALERTSLTFVEGGRRSHFGDPDAELRACVWIEDAGFYRAVALRGSIGAAESFMDGAWHADDLAAVIRILAREQQALARLNGRTTRWVLAPLVLLHALRSNTRRGSRRNIADHYDLGNEFFELFLDPTLTYSCGIFEHPEATLEEASIAKYERVCRKLRLSPDDHVLEIGSGWGGFALHAASRYGCRVTTTTLSRNQLELARKRVAQAGLEGRVELRFDDYRDLRGQYDRLVSIEMIEAVGHRHLDDFMRVCGDRLKDGGAMLLQAITVPDRRIEQHRRTVDFVKRYIFPGGELVSVGTVNDAAARNSDLRLTHLEDITPHYAETLRRWHLRMNRNRDAMKSLGLPESFLRMWEFYLCYCQAGFAERENGVVQMLLEKRGARREPILGTLG